MSERDREAYAAMAYPLLKTLLDSDSDLAGIATRIRWSVDRVERFFTHPYKFEIGDAAVIALGMGRQLRLETRPLGVFDNLSLEGKRP